jgi:hypothetical protein
LSHSAGKGSPRQHIKRRVALQDNVSDGAEEALENGCWNVRQSNWQKGRLVWVCLGP